MTNAYTTAFRVRRRAEVLEKVIDIRQAHGLPAGDIIGLWAQLIALAETMEQSLPCRDGALRPRDTVAAQKRAS